MFIAANIFHGTQGLQARGVAQQSVEHYPNLIAELAIYYR